MRNYGLSSPRTVGGFDQPAGSRHGQHYAPLPANSILTPDDPSTPEEREIITFAAIGLGIAVLIICIGAVCFGASLFLKP